MTEVHQLHEELPATRSHTGHSPDAVDVVEDDVQIGEWPELPGETPVERSLANRVVVLIEGRELNAGIPRQPQFRCDQTRRDPVAAAKTVDVGVDAKCDPGSRGEKRLELGLIELPVVEVAGVEPGRVPDPSAPVGRVVDARAKVPTTTGVSSSSAGDCCAR